MTAPTVGRVVAWWAALRRPAADSTPGTAGTPFPCEASLRPPGVNVTDPAPFVAGVGTKATSPASNQRQDASVLDRVFPPAQCVHKVDGYTPRYSETR